MVIFNSYVKLPEGTVTAVTGICEPGQVVMFAMRNSTNHNFFASSSILRFCVAMADLGFTITLVTICGWANIVQSMSPSKNYSSIPIGSMYGIYANIWGILMVNVIIYNIHGSYGILIFHDFPSGFNQEEDDRDVQDSSCNLGTMNSGDILELNGGYGLVKSFWTSYEWLAIVCHDYYQRVRSTVVSWHVEMWLELVLICPADGDLDYGDRFWNIDQTREDNNIQQHQQQ